MTEPKKTGRPPLPPEEKQVRRALYLPPALWAKIDAHGGIAWLREVIRRSRLPKP